MKHGSKQRFNPRQKPSRSRETVKENIPGSKFVVEEEEELLALLLKELSNRSRNSVKSILARGQVAINGTPTTQFNAPLQKGQTVTVDWTRQGDSSTLKGLAILYEDEDLIVVDKREGLLTIATDTERQETAYRELMEYVQSADPKNRVFIVHRLDRDTSGVLMFAKSEAIQQALQTAWKESVFERTYLALVEGEVKKKTGTLTSWLKETRTHLVVSSPKPNGGQKAVTHYSSITSNRNYSLLKVNLETGRKNQIRVAMQEMGHPVVGDKKYGGKGNPIGRLGLHAHVLGFSHPRTGKHMRFESPTPSAFFKVIKR